MAFERHRDRHGRPGRPATPASGIWIVSDAVAPTVTITQPAVDDPAVGGSDRDVRRASRSRSPEPRPTTRRLKNVEITLRNSSTRENLGNDCSWGVNVSRGQLRISPVNIGNTSYNWSLHDAVQPQPGSYSFSVRATDDDGLTTSSTNQGRLTLTARFPATTPPDALTPEGTVTAPVCISLAGTATDDIGVKSVKVTVYDNDTGRYMQANGTWPRRYNDAQRHAATPNATSTTWTLPIVLPTKGTSA